MAADGQRRSRAHDDLTREREVEPLGGPPQDVTLGHGRHRHADPSSCADRRRPAAAHVLLVRPSRLSRQAQPARRRREAGGDERLADGPVQRAAAEHVDAVDPRDGEPARRAGCAP